MLLEYFENIYGIFNESQFYKQRYCCYDWQKELSKLYKTGGKTVILR